MKIKHDYSALDAALLTDIEAMQPVPSYKLEGGRVRAAAMPIADKERHTPVWFVIARRLQFLRKSGLIAYSRKPEGWSLVKGD